MPLAKEPELVDWSSEAARVIYAPLPQGVIHSVIHGFAERLAEESGLHSQWLPTEAGTPPCWVPSEDDRARALRQPLPVAVVLAELCRSSGIEIPDVVRRAMDECDDLPWLIED